MGQNQPANRSPGVWHADGLGLVLLAWCAVALVAQARAGWQVHDAERMEEGTQPLALGGYVGRGHFISASFENRESGFLQVAVWPGEAPLSLAAHPGGAQSWFQWFQDWRSEFLSVSAIPVLPVWLRQDSPQSRRVDAPHRQAGT